MPISLVRRFSARALLLAFALAALAPTLSACNTTAGAGQDVSAAGRAVWRKVSRRSAVASCRLTSMITS